LARDFVRNGAEVLVNITNDTWYGATAAPMQHFQFGAFRAIEQRRPLLRCANSGYSAHIDATGAVRSRTDLFEEGLLVDTVHSSSYRSVYSRVGEWINMFLVGLALLGLFFPRRRR
jgi:apolipoprotein N-acyltransferase